ncbi:MAG: DUF2793 domain-containing protein [Paracoccaceae bacterium]
MAETANLLLPFLAAGQAQKHLTVNDAFERLDVLLMLSAKSRTSATPPAAPDEGDRYLVPAGAAGAWTGEDGRVAAFLNGGWRFFAPRPGWRCFVEDEGGDAVFGSGVWTGVAAQATATGAIRTIEFEHVIASGGAQASAGLIPAGSVVFGVTLRVLETVTGVTGWSLGVAEAPERHGKGLPVALGAVQAAATGAPLAHPSAIPLLLTPEGGSFSGGRVRLAIHHLELPAPSA